MFQDINKVFRAAKKRVCGKGEFVKRAFRAVAAVLVVSTMFAGCAVGPYVASPTPPGQDVKVKVFGFPLLKVSNGQGDEGRFVRNVFGFSIGRGGDSTGFYFRDNTQPAHRYP